MAILEWLVVMFLGTGQSHFSYCVYSWGGHVFDKACDMAHVMCAESAVCASGRLEGLCAVAASVCRPRGYGYTEESRNKEIRIY